MRAAPRALTATLATLAMLTACVRTHAWPSEPADIVGFVQEVRVIPGRPGPSVIGAGGGGAVRRLQIRVTAAREIPPGATAYVGVDGITRVGRRQGGSDVDLSELQGTYVRIWLRDKAPGWSRFDAATMARAIAVDPEASAAAPSAVSIDSALVGSILLAEDRRDSTAAALAVGEKSADEQVRLLTRRARVRIRDPRAAARDSMAPLRAPLPWPEPAWKAAYRALVAPTANCDALRGAVRGTGAWQVRLRAADLVTATCATDDSLAAALRGWIDALPADASARTRDGVSWHAAAHAVVALARMRPADARPRAAALARHRQWQVRAYAARAAAVVADTTLLRALARDENANVQEAAIVALAKLTGHADDSLFVAALGGSGAPAVRAAVIALKGSPRPDVAAAANAAFERWVAHGSASERDVRVALLDAAGRPATDDRPPAIRHELPPEAVPLALGADVRLRVRLAPSAGGGSFVVRLRGDAAPIMAARILALARTHYYDGTDWHRVEPDFVIQGGGHGSSEYVGYSQYLRDELGTVPHLRGTVGMSTRGHDSGDAQWFVNLKDNRILDRDYTVFAEVVEGMDVVDGILEGDIIATVEQVGAPAGEH